MMLVFSLIVRPNVPGYTRILAFLNLFCFFYMLGMTITVTKLSFVYIVPNCYSEDPWTVFVHRVAIAYIFISVVGSFITCVCTDAGAVKKIKTDRENKEKSKGSDRSEQRVNVIPWRRQKSRATTNGKTPKFVDKIPKVSTEMTKTKLCGICDKVVPERSHHCVLCEKCIYKRDHHCFFMGVCVGYNNQKYFIFFLLFMGIGTFYGMLLIVQYMSLLFGVTFHGPQTFLSIFFDTIFSLARGKGPSLKFVFLMILMNASLFATMFAFGFLYWQMFVVLRGQTSFECTRGIKTYTKPSKLANFREVFGKWWIMSLCVPFIDLIR